MARWRRAWTRYPAVMVLLLAPVAFLCPRLFLLPSLLLYHLVALVAPTVVGRWQPTASVEKVVEVAIHTLGSFDEGTVGWYLCWGEM